MTLQTVRSFLAWCAVLDIGLALLYWLVIVFAHDWVYRMHGKWFKLSVETFDAIHYGTLATFKLGFFLFVLVPYLALRIIG